MINYNKITKLDSTNLIENRIIDAFMTLYANKPIEKISIKSITDLAGLNRGTFYLHYLDIYDLLEKNELKEAIRSKYEIPYDKDTELNAYALEYITSAQVATIIHWIQNDMSIPLKDISKLMQSLSTNGALKYFESSSKYSDLSDPI